MIIGQVSHLSSDVSRITLNETSYYVARGPGIYIAELLGAPNPHNEEARDAVRDRLTSNQNFEKISLRDCMAYSQLPRYIRAAEWLRNPESTLSKPRMSLWKPALALSLAGLGVYQINDHVLKWSHAALYQWRVALSA